ncbi:DUF1183 domain-containing protein [Histoplasma capsulatum var. duboisii H88]|uniref:Store-operated calcium entry-associated regulatory factor n=1 Tax=Ajellomyces capsulatus (strain H88) TaxID=544711 RepID=F0UR54_AJEC8|nr:DUF1183 domain-containing protein [Histoplasma capsulatum var. duboisii H88]QSS50404.1 DUF1183 domain-containing protein [Histoplasma capsulatum var. duboisii H88]
MTRIYTTIVPLLSVLLSLLPAQAQAYKPSRAPASKDAVLLSAIQSLTFHSNRKTTHRRLPAVEQLTCIGPSKKICALYTPDTMRCVNQGHDYDVNDVQWTCTAHLPPEFRLGSTDVVCEGYRDKEDPWVLKGSCGVEYRLLLTERGEQRYGELVGGYGNVRSWLESLWELISSLLFYGVLAVIFLLAYGCLAGGARQRRGGRPWWGWGGGGGPGGGGGGGWGGWGGWNDPPPPYEYSGFRKMPPWTPGFWTGAAAGSAAAYALGRRGGSESRSGWGWGSDRAESSRARYSRPAFSPSASTTESTGFGGSRRR